MVLENYQHFLKAMYKNNCELSFEKKYRVNDFLQKEIEQ